MSLQFEYSSKCIWKRTIQRNKENVNWLLYYNFHGENDMTWKNISFFSVNLLHLHLYRSYNIIKQLGGDAVWNLFSYSLATNYTNKLSYLFSHYLNCYSYWHVYNTKKILDLRMRTYNSFGLL